MKGKDNLWLLMKSKDEFSGANVKFDENSAISGLDFKGIEKNGAVYSSEKGKKLSKTEIEKEEKKDPEKKKPRQTLIRNEADFSAEDLVDAEK
ncbi:hypothetical protein H9W95_15395 [Flavobacterium lindanitolerans]|nr:hypothetical protein [Flavobacterium lindanitolerans]